MYCEVTYMRKGFDNQIGLVQNYLDQSPTNGDVLLKIETRLSCYIGQERICILITSVWKKVDPGYQLMILNMAVRG